MLCRCTLKVAGPFSALHARLFDVINRRSIRFSDMKVLQPCTGHTHWMPTYKQQCSWQRCKPIMKGAEASPPPVTYSTDIHLLPARWLYASIWQLLQERLSQWGKTAQNMMPSCAVGVASRLMMLVAQKAQPVGR